jgi:hypothetical protein
MKKYYRLFSCFLLAMMLLSGNHVMACSCCDNTDTISPASYVTATQYCEYLNENASPEDPNGLYDKKMGGIAKTPALIIRTKTDDGYSYSVASGQEEAPIYVNHKNKKLFLKWCYEKLAEIDDESIVRPLTLSCGCYQHGCSICRINYLYCPCP